ncbi:MFS transporter [Nocardiopsis gilva YIM 90087]|uniref:MFS transporter n=1 Tax=Nocardiopsis gilva YIM 90087 TaxID=1235441 RepID=A0A223S8B6_9ACTN|nr:MFS transporter [Nocardiopsis gilva YIM 90087]
MRRARRAVAVYFFVAGVIIASWAARVPAVKAQTGLDDGRLSVGLLGLAIGALAAMQVAGRMTDRFGSAAIVLPAAVGGGLALVVPGYADSLPVLFGALFAVGAGHGMIDVPMNVHAARVERRYGRPIMASFHAAFSFGGFAGAGLGALAARAEVGATAHFWAVALTTVALSVAVRRGLLPGRDAASTTPHDARPSAAGGGGTAVPGPDRRARLAPRVLVFGVVAFGAFLAEGSALDWSSVYLHDTRGASPAVAAVGFAVFSATMAAGRLVSDRLSGRFGPVAVVRGGGMLAAAGLGVALLVPVPWLAVTGFGLMGAGLSGIVPQVFTAAAALDPLRAGRNLGMVAAAGYVGLLSGPVLIGAIAHFSGLAVALAVPALLALLVAAVAGALRGGR